jgi:hypothetical protein
MFDGRLLANVERVAVTFSDGARQELRFPARMEIDVNGPWQVTFTDGRSAPPEVMLPELISWTEHPDAGVKFYSGTAVYRTQFDLPAGFVQPGMVTLLDLGVVADIAEVRINGESAGVVWAPPFRLDVSRLLHAGRNELEVLVANEWVNRMIGDERIPVDYSYRTEGNKFTIGALEELPAWLYDPAKRTQRKRESFATWKHYSADSPLLPSGLLGPVTLERRFAIAGSP